MFGALRGCEAYQGCQQEAPASECVGVGIQDSDLSISQLSYLHCVLGSITASGKMISPFPYHFLASFPGHCSFPFPYYSLASFLGHCPVSFPYHCPDCLLWSLCLLMKLIRAFSGVLARNSKLSGSKVLKNALYGLGQVLISLVAL